MKNGLRLVGAIALTALFVACGGDKAKPEADFRCKQGGELAPEWTCMPSTPKGIAAVGSAKPNAGGDVDLQMREAMSNGRDALATRIEVKVKTMIKNWKRATGSGEDQTFEKNLESVSKQVASQTLNGSKQLKYWKQSDGTLWLLVGIDNNEPILKATKNSAKTSFKNDEALWQQFQSKKAMDELDAELSKP